MTTFSAHGLAHMMLSHLEMDTASFADLASAVGVAERDKARRKAWYALDALRQSGFVLHHRDSYTITTAGMSALAILRTGCDFVTSDVGASA